MYLLWVSFYPWHVGRKGFYSRNCSSPSTSLKLGDLSHTLHTLSTQLPGHFLLLPAPVPSLASGAATWRQECCSSVFDSTLQSSTYCDICSFVGLRAAGAFLPVLKQPNSGVYWICGGVRIWHLFRLPPNTINIKSIDNSHVFPAFNGKQNKTLCFWLYFVGFVCF